MSAPPNNNSRFPEQMNRAANHTRGGILRAIVLFFAESLVKRSSIASCFRLYVSLRLRVFVALYPSDFVFMRRFRALRHRAGQRPSHIIIFYSPTRFAHSPMSVTTQHTLLFTRASYTVPGSTIAKALTRGRTRRFASAALHSPFSTLHWRDGTEVMGSLLQSRAFSYFLRGCATVVFLMNLPAGDTKSLGFVDVPNVLCLPQPSFAQNLG